MQLELPRCRHRAPISALTAAYPASAWGATSSRLARPSLRQRLAGALAKKGPNRATAHMQALLAPWYRQGEMEERNRSERKASIKRVREIV